MQEEANLHILNSITHSLPEHGWEEHEMVVVYPDQIVILQCLCDSFSEQLIRISVRYPRAFVEANLARMVMEQGPQD